ncbi:MAG: molybdopterin-guanine dinucleotide biosynthesis protein MobB [Gemmatimonadota bacterium]
MPPIVSFLGKKKSGKTAVTVAVAAELTRRGRRVMTIKHGHGFDLDRQGTDSWRHMHEGRAHRVVLAAPGEFAVMGEWPDGQPLGPDVRDLPARGPRRTRLSPGGTGVGPLPRHGH